jgi:ubiquinone/menaquinone biosynthesis C-methylase UbiE/uncharacterized protein YbaR (Trm112 family)
MKRSVLPWLCCPKCRGDLVLDQVTKEDTEIREGRLACGGCTATFPILRSVPRFVPDDGYADNFSFEWNVHRTTQLDSVNGRHDSEERFARSLGYPLEELKGKRVLDVGCGTGRFAEVVLKYGGTVVGIDLSMAVEAATKNIGDLPGMNILQANVFDLPFKYEQFDLIYSLGVLHHTPNCRKAFEALPPFLKAGGAVLITLYTDTNKYYIASTDFWRRWTTKMSPKTLYALCHIAVPLYYLYKIPVLRQAAMAVFPINMDKDWHWRVLDTYDCYSPAYQSYHNYPQVFEWYETAGLSALRAREPAVTVIGTKAVR